MLAGAAGYVGNDSGPSHLAAAVGTPTLVLFGPTGARHFSPLGPRVRTRQAAALADVAPPEVFRLLRELSGRPQVPAADP
jgi:ADP-heptose:LPS heptosyltransferase